MKFDCLSEQVKGNLDNLLVLETKIDDSFPIGQSAFHYRWLYTPL